MHASRGAKLPDYASSSDHALPYRDEEYRSMYLLLLTSVAVPMVERALGTRAETPWRPSSPSAVFPQLFHHDWRSAACHGS